MRHKTQARISRSRFFDILLPFCHATRLLTSGEPDLRAKSTSVSPPRRGGSSKLFGFQRSGTARIRLGSVSEQLMISMDTVETLLGRLYEKPGT